MNTVIENILTRRSIRDFSPKKVSKDDIEKLIETGLYAPCGIGKQTWNFVGVLNFELISELALSISKVLDRENYNFYGSKSLILISNEKNGKFSKEDNAAALQNIMLAAHSLDIGSVWINQLQGICDHEDIRPILTKLNIPLEHEIYGLVALGYSSSEPRGKVEKKGKFSIIE